MRATAVIGLVVVAIVAAALRPHVPLAVSVAEERSRAGGSVTVHLHNRGSQPFGYNACSWRLERRGDLGWRPAPHEDERACTMDLRRLPPGQRVRAAFALDERLPPGRYRLRITLNPMKDGEREVRRTGPFRIGD